MIEPKSRELQAMRIDIALNICINHPQVLEALMGDKPKYLDVKDAVALSLVRIMMKAEPCIKNILSFYYKRELR
jgi:hypothetical protein